VRNELDKLFNSDYYRDLALSHLSELDYDQKQSWFKHPATQSLLRTLMGDYIDYHEAWENGGFVTESADGTAQKNAKALGALEAIKMIVSYIEEIPSAESDGISGNSET